MKYDEYLQSDEWKELRAKAYERAGNKCELCGREAGAVHHIKYPKHLKDDELSNLLVVCTICHDKLHGLNHSRNYEVMFIDLMNDLVFLLRSIAKENHQDRVLIKKYELDTPEYRILEYKIGAVRSILRQFGDLHDKHHPDVQDEGEVL